MTDKRDQLGQSRAKAKSFKERFVSGFKKASRGELFDHGKIRKVKRDNRIRKSFMSAVRSFGTDEFKKDARVFSDAVMKRLINYGKQATNVLADFAIYGLSGGPKDRLRPTVANIEQRFKMNSNRARR